MNALAILKEASSALAALKDSEDSDLGLARMVGHKADLMLTHYSRNYEGMAHAQMVFEAAVG